MKVIGTPESNSDVVNKEPQVLLIGYGWVGQYMGKYFKTAHYVTGDGIIRSQDGETIIRDTNQVGVKGLHYDLAIIGVPTPMNYENGQCDTSYVESVVENYAPIVDNFLIKSTVEIGTTDRLSEKYNARIAMSPEYVGETLGHPLLEARRDAFQIIGGTPEVTNAIAEFFYKVLHASAPIYLCTAKEAEIIKYCENMWIKDRVDYWNDVYEITETLGASFNAVREGLVLDPRMSRTHSFVYKDNRGWSGKCLPKDMNALAYKMRKAGHPLQRLEHSIRENVVRRGNIKSTEKLIPERPLWER